MKMKNVWGCLIAGAIWGGAAYADDWPQFCGMQRNNTSAETGLARSWPAGGPPEVWSVDVTTGYAGPAIKDGKVYLMDHTNAVSSIRCFAFDSGKELWSCAFDDPGELKNKKYPGTRGTPTVTEDSLYAVTLFGTAVCMDLKTRKLKWQHNLKQEYGKEVGGFGVAQSPLLYGDLVILAPMSAEGSVVAVNRSSGDVVWKTSGHPGTGFVSPSLISVDGEDQILVVAGGEKPPKKTRRKKKKDPAVPKKLRPTYVLALSPQDGKVLWSYDGWKCHNPIPHPIRVDKNTLFVTSGYKSVSKLIKLKKSAAGFDVEELMETKDAASQIEQPVFANGHLFVGGTVKSARKGLVCIDLNGTVKWDASDIESAPRFNDLNMLVADGMLIGLDGSSGMLYLIEATPKGFNELASAKVVAEKGQTWAPIALSNGKLIVRDHTVMKCLNLR